MEAVIDAPHLSLRCAGPVPFPLRSARQFARPMTSIKLFRPQCLQYIRSMKPRDWYHATRELEPQAPGTYCLLYLADLRLAAIAGTSYVPASYLKVITQIFGGCDTTVIFSWLTPCFRVA